MASFVVFDVTDSEGRTSPWRMRVTDRSVDTDLQDFVDNVATAAFGATKPIGGSLTNVKLEVGALHAPIAGGVDSDVRDNWQARMLTALSANYRMGIPARNLLPGLISSGSLILADLSAAAWSDLLTALTTGTVKVENDKTGDEATDWGPVIAQVRARKRPRVGGKR